MSKFKEIVSGEVASTSNDIKQKLADTTFVSKFKEIVSGEVASNDIKQSIIREE